MILQPNCSTSVLKIDLDKLSEEDRIKVNEILSCDDWVHIDEEIKGVYSWEQTSPNFKLIDYLKEKNIDFTGDFPFVSGDKDTDDFLEEHEK